MVNANEFTGLTDSEVLENAVKGRTTDGIVVISPRNSEIEPERNYWLIDRAILLPENTTVILQNCKIKLSDQCRDNFFRSANCGMGIEFPEKISNIHIKGEGLCILEGADRPRATGDETKELHAPCPHFPEDLCKVADWIPAERRTLEKIGFHEVHSYSYGTDALNPNESQYGDWRGIGVLFANVENFSISNLKIVKSHGWGVSLEACSYGQIEKIEFDATMYKEIDGMMMNMENQDGIDIRNGCHHIMISDITGQTGDDVIALTAIASPNYRPGGTVKNTHVMHNDWAKREKDIHDIIIRNIMARSYLCYTVRLLPVLSKIYNVVMDGIIDTTEEMQAQKQSGTLLLGSRGKYGENLPGSLKNIIVSNIICDSKNAIVIPGFLSDSVITNVVNKNPDCEAIAVARKDALTNVVISNIASFSTRETE